MPSFENLTLPTPRLRLRPLRPDDATALFEMFSDASVMRYWSSLPWTTPEPAQAMIARDQAAMASGEQLRLGLETIADGALIGQCTLFSISTPCRRAEIGYSLRASAWGQGYMHEALQALVGYGFTSMQLNRIEADIDPRNHASARSLQRLGFTLEGHLRERWIVGDEVSDTALYGLLQREWAAARG